MNIKRTIPTLLCLFVLMGCWGAATEVEAQFGLRYNPLGRQQWQSDLRHSYRPRIKVVRAPGASRELESGRTLTFEYYARQGHVARIEVRSGLKVVKTLHVGPSKSGRGQFKVKASELSRSFGKRSFKLWAWQGRQGYQSLHGESVSYTLSE